MSVTEQLNYLSVRSKYDEHLSSENDRKVKMLKKEIRFLRDALERKATEFGFDAFEALAVSKTNISGDTQGDSQWDF